MNKPLASICCITYNHAPYIREAIEGFLMQETNFPFEIIIHDDASTDGTAEIIKEYADKHPDLIIPILQKENKYTKGFRIPSEYLWPKVRGEYIAFCEGDDYWTDKLKLQKQVSFLENNPDYSITYHDVKIIDEQGKALQESALSKSSKKDFSREELIKAPSILTCTKCYRNLRGEMREIDGDILVNSFFGNYGKGKYMPEIGKSVYRKHYGGVWTSRTKSEKRLAMATSRLGLYHLYVKLNKPKYIKYFRKQVNKYIYELIATTNFRIQTDIKTEFLNVLKDNYDILSVRNKIFYKALSKEHEQGMNAVNFIFLFFARAVVCLNVRIFFAFISWCKWKIGLFIKNIKKDGEEKH